ncbi:hypothetical protein CJF31_00006082 [Rutstroemia sp. NJR-2017a BVV2]|nr:hypothetical protein CJF31_00006082 [Rutstroemia sp. NJR-2017a BVV2]
MNTTISRETLFQKKKSPRKPSGLGYLPTVAYGQSKTAIILYYVQLSKLLANKGVTIVCVQPGGQSCFPFEHLHRANISTSTAIATDAPQICISKIARSNLFLSSRQMVIRERLWRLTENLVKQTFSLHSTTA